jgi:predicted transcriptional regulator
MSTTRPTGFNQLAAVLAEADKPLTAREIHDRLRDRGIENCDSSYRVATVLGRAAERGAPIEVVDGSPYRYRLSE